MLINCSERKKNGVLYPDWLIYFVPLDSDKPDSTRLGRMEPLTIMDTMLTIRTKVSLQTCKWMEHMSRSANNLDTVV
jgi:hypothetical protein